MIYIFAMFTIAILLSYIYRHYPLHPLFWAPIFFSIYGSWYYLSLVTLGANISAHDRLALQLHLISIIAFSVPCLILVPKCFFSRISLKSRTFLLDRKLAVVMILMFLSYLLLAVASGAASKRDVLEGVGRTYSLLGSVGSLGVMIFAVRAVACRYFGTKQRTLPISVFLVVALLAFLVVGEREFLFSISLVWFLVSVTVKQKDTNFVVFYAVIIVGIFAVSASHGLKSALIGEVDWDFVMFNSVFNSDFAAPGRNFKYLEFAGYDDRVGFSVIATEVQRFLFSFIPGSDLESMAQWFNRTYRVDLGIGGTSGWGFTMVGSAYLAGGALAVCLYYFVIGLTVSATIRVARSSDTFLITYLFIIPVIIYTTRQDLSYFMNYYVKYGLIVNGLIHVISRYLLIHFPKVRNHERPTHA